MKSVFMTTERLFQVGSVVRLKNWFMLTEFHVLVGMNE